VVLLNEEHKLDGLLLEKCRVGDEQAFEAFVERYQHALYTLLYRFLGDAHSVIEATRDTFNRANTTIQDIPEETDPLTWLYGIAWNVARNLTPEHAAIEGSDEFESDEVDLLQNHINQLPEHLRMVFVLSTFALQRYDDIAEIMGCPASTVKSRMNQARMQLRDRLITSEKR